MDHHTKEKAQQQLFYLLYEFALKTCYRYTSTNQQPELRAHEGFVRLFRQNRRVVHSDPKEAKRVLHRILIELCLEKENEQFSQQIDFAGDVPFRPMQKDVGFKTLSDKEMMDLLRALPFPLRAVYNLSVIDGFDDVSVSAVTGIPMRSVPAYLSQARMALEEAIRINPLSQSIA